MLIESKVKLSVPKWKTNEQISRKRNKHLY